MSFALRIALLLVFLLAAVLLVLLATASSSSSVVDRFYPWLVAANAVVAAFMAGLTAWVVFRAWGRWRQKIFGARLMVRLALAFALIGTVPILLVSFVSAQFLAKTIDSWFSQSVNVALDSGLSLGRASVEAIQNDVIAKTRRLAIAVAESSNAEMVDQIEKIIDGREGVDVLVISGSGTVLASRSAQLSSLVSDLPSSEALNQARATRQYISVEPRRGATEASLQVRAIAMTTRVTPGSDETRFIQWIEQIPPGLARNLEALDAGIRDYEQLIVGKEGLQKIYGVTLLLTLLLAFFAALVSAVLLSGWLAGPLRQLERATKAVASGDFRPLKADTRSNDELNLLVHSFNEMTVQLTDARELATKSRLRLEESNLFLQQVLAHLSAGVLICDAKWQLTQCNAGAEKILSVALDSFMGRPLTDLPLLSECAQALKDGLKAEPEIQLQQDVMGAEGAQVTLLVSATRLPGQEPRYVLVFDDISALLSAQRSKAFADMARRLAHEIKNPLTPIQLSAERLQRRLLDKLQPEDSELLNRSIGTIVDQVAGLKAMVDEFRNYARLPAANPEPLDLDWLLREMLVLYASDRRIRQESDGKPHRIVFDRTQLIQVVHNLIQNAQDAVADKPGAEIVVSVDEIAVPGQSPAIRLRIIDNGPGLSPEARHRLFEPYFTSKAKGSGLGLAIVKKIMEENRAKVSLSNRLDPVSGQVLGAVAAVEFAKLSDEVDNQLLGLKRAAKDHSKDTLG